MAIQDFTVIPGSAPQAGETAGPAAREDSAPVPADGQEELRRQLERLRQEHRDLDAAIEALANAPGRDLLQVQRLKKRKLVLRDRIIQIEDQITPDIIA